MLQAFLQSYLEIVSNDFGAFLLTYCLNGDTSVHSGTPKSSHSIIISVLLCDNHTNVCQLMLESNSYIYISLLFVLLCILLCILCHFMGPKKGFSVLVSYYFDINV